MVRSQYQVMKVDNNIDDEIACLIEPAAIAHYCFRLMSKDNVRNILIFVCGTIGIILLRILKYYLGDKVSIDCVSLNPFHQKRPKYQALI